MGVPMTQPGSVEDRIALSTLQLLRTGGPRAVTMEAVAADSGVAKTTIYRRHRDRRDLLTTTLSGLATPEPLDRALDPPDRLRWIIDRAIEIVEHGVGLGGVAAMLTDEDSEFSALFRNILRDRRRHLSAEIDACKADGSIRDDVDAATLIDAIVGAYLTEYARSGEVAAGWSARLFDLLWPAVRPRR